MARPFRKIAKLISVQQRNLRRYRRLWASAPIDPSCVLLEQQAGLTANGNLYHIAREMASASALGSFKAHFVADSSRQRDLSRELAERGLDIDIVERRSQRYYELLATSGHLICDTSFPPEFAKRPGQMLTNTWHGTPLKRLGRHIPGEGGRIGNVQKSFMAADLILCPNEFTAERLSRDYMFDGFAPGDLLMGGYPRNAALFGGEAPETGPGCRYAYMPTFRTASDGSRDAAVSDIASRLTEIDELLCNDEKLFAQLHPVVGATLDFSAYRHVRPFPAGIETYDFLASCDALVTDYSSVMFDFAATGRKVVLYTFDEDGYAQDRGLYLDMDELPFPRVREAGALVDELRRPKEYDDAALLKRFCPYDSPLATSEFCDRVLLGHPAPEGREKPVRRAGSKALVYIGYTPGNDLAEVIEAVEHIAKSHEVLLAFPARIVEEQPDFILEMPEDVSFIPVAGKSATLLHERAADKFAQLGLIGPRVHSIATRSWRTYELARQLCDMSFDLIVCCPGSNWRLARLLADARASRKLLVSSETGIWPHRMRKQIQDAFDATIPRFSPECTEKQIG